MEFFFRTPPHFVHFVNKIIPAKYENLLEVKVSVQK